MKNTLKALKYTFMQINKPFTCLVVFGYMALLLVPVFMILHFVSYRKFDVLSLKIPMMNAFTAIIIPMAFIIKIHLSSCKYNYSLSFAKELHTVVPAILSYTVSIAVFILFVSLAGQNFGRESLAAILLIGSAGFSMIGAAASFSASRVRDFLIPVILAVVFSGLLTDRLVDLLAAVFSVAYAAVISVLVFAVSIAVTVFRLNRIWMNKSRFIKAAPRGAYILNR